MKFIIFLILSYSVSLFAQFGKNSSTSDTRTVNVINRADGTSIYDRIIGSDTVLSVDSNWVKGVAQTDFLAVAISKVSERIDGFYYNNLDSLLSDQFFGRGFGRMGNSYRIMRDQYLSGFAVYTSPDARLTAGTATVEVYRNGLATGYMLQLSTTNPQMNILNLPSKQLKLYGYDYVQLKLATSSTFRPVNQVDLDAVIEFNYITQPQSGDSGYVLTVLAIDSGQVIVNPDKPYYSYGETVVCTSRANSGWKHNTWTGASNSMDTVITIYMTNNKTLNARYSKITPNPYYRILISDPISGGDSTHAKTVREAFLAGYNEANGTALTADSVLIFEEFNLANGASFRKADQVGAEVVIRATSGLGYFLTVAQKYYPIQTFGLAGGQSAIRYHYNAGVIPSVMVIGATNANWGYENRIGYDVEMLADDPINTYPTEPVASWVVGNAAGLFAGTVEYLYSINGFRDYYALRHLFRYSSSEMLKNYDGQNGYGFIDSFSLGDLSYVITYGERTTGNPYYFRNLDPYLVR